jgi:hypothetical protein
MELVHLFHLLLFTVEKEPKNFSEDAERSQPVLLLSHGRNGALLLASPYRARRGLFYIGNTGYCFTGLCRDPASKAFGLTSNKKFTRIGIDTVIFKSFF